MPQPTAVQSGSLAATTARRAAAVVSVGAVAAPLGWLAYSALGVNHHVPLPPAIQAERRTFRSSRAGRLAYYAREDGSGRPVVLLHSVNAAASAAEMRPLFDRLAGRRPVYALDLPGFGFSERSERAYTPRLYADAILDFLAAELGEDGPCDLVALSLTSEFAARAALERPELIASLTLVSPTGFGADAAPSERAAADAGSDTVLRAVSARPWGQPVYDLLTSRPSIRYYLRKSFAGRVDEALAEYGWRSAHQPGARHAPFYFLSGKLFTPDARERLYDRLSQPVLVLYDTDPYAGFEQLAGTVARRPNWRALRIAGTRGLPHFDRPLETMRALRIFWLGLGEVTRRGD